MSTLTGNTLLPGKTAELTASGAVAAGKPVILNSAGTVTQVGETVYSEDLGDPENVASTAYEAYHGPFITYDSTNDKVVAVWWRSSDKYGFAAVGTVSGDSISWGTPAAFLSTAGDEVLCAAHDGTNNKIVISYSQGGGSGANYGWCVVGTVSGTSISFGTGVVSSSVWTPRTYVSWDPGAGKMVVMNKQYPNGGKVAVGTVSGTSISYGTFVQFTSSNNNDNLSSYYDSNVGKTVLVWNENTGHARVASVSGTAITLGTDNSFYSASVFALYTTYDTTAKKGIVTWTDQASPKYGKAAVISVSGTTVTVGTPTTYSSVSTGTGEKGHSCHYAGDGANKTVIAYSLDAGSTSSNLPHYVLATLSGTTLSYTSPARLYTDNAGGYKILGCNTKNGVVVLIHVPAATVGDLIDNYMYTIVYQVAASITNLTTANFLGIADEAIADTAVGSISIKGGLATAGLSSLTPGTDYYTQGDSTINTTSTSPAVKLGKALSATALSLEYRS
jgi:hypothetical protein